MDKIIATNCSVVAAAAKLILAELIVSVESMHKKNVLHLDLHSGNVLVDSDGHLVVIDYGYAKWLSDKIPFINFDWFSISRTFSGAFKCANVDEYPKDILHMLHDMKDEQVPGNTLMRLILLTLLDNLK